MWESSGDWPSDLPPLAPMAKALIAVLLLALFWCLETWRPFFGQPARTRHAFRNLAIAILNTLVIGLVFGSVTLGVAFWAEAHGQGLLHVLDWPAGLELVLAIVLLDGWMYLWHRANHRLAWLWRFHRMHHSDRHMDVTTATRFHLGEHTGAALVRLVLVALLGLSMTQLVVYEALVLAVTQFHHADISLGRWDRWLRLLIVTPDMHKIHHSRSHVETDSNYSTLFSFWDRLGLTFRMRRDLRSLRFGLAEFDAAEWQTLWGMLKTPLADQAASSSPARKAELPRASAVSSAK